MLLCRNWLAFVLVQAPCITQTPHPGAQEEDEEQGGEGKRERDKPLSASSIRTNNHTLPHIQILPNPPERTWFRIQIIHRHVEEPLDLARMQIHRDNVITTRCLQHIGYQFRAYGSPRFVFLVLPRVGEVRDYGCNAPGGCGLASVDHDEQFHEPVIDVAGRRGL
jgi:hypothetical protein